MKKRFSGPQIVAKLRQADVLIGQGKNVPVCKWIGNSPEVAMQHYAQVTEADLQEAAKMAVINNAEKRVHNPVHTTAEPSCTESHESKAAEDLTPCFCGTNDNNSAWCESMQKPQDYPKGGRTKIYNQRF